MLAISNSLPFVQNGPSQPGGHLHTNDVLPLSLTQCPLFWHLNSVQGTCLSHQSPVNSCFETKRLNTGSVNDDAAAYVRNTYKTLLNAHCPGTYLKTMAVWLHVHIQPTAAAVVAQVSSARRPVAVCDVPARGDR